MYIGIVFNRKGQSEANYLYTLEEMTKLDCKTLIEAVEADGEPVDGPAFAADKTSVAYLLKNDSAVKDFLSGKRNRPDTDNPDWRDSGEWADWVWYNDIDNDLYFVGDSFTMNDALNKYNLPAYPYQQ